MCGRYTLRRINWYRDAKGFPPPPFEEFSEMRVRFNIAPSLNCPVIRMSKEGAPKLGLARWGLIPSWTKGKPNLQPINAKCETAATSGMFRQALERRRQPYPAEPMDAHPVSTRVNNVRNDAADLVEPLAGE
jgi:putative SOS response-associated peptidase YedK